MKKKSPLFRVIGLYIKKHKITFICMVICVLLTALGSISAPLTLQKVSNTLTEIIKTPLDDVTSRSEAWTSIMYSGFLLIGAYVISILAGFTYSQLTAVSGQVFMDELRKDLFDHMEDLPINILIHTKKVTSCQFISTTLIQLDN